MKKMLLAVLLSSFSFYSFAEFELTTQHGDSNSVWEESSTTIKLFGFKELHTDIKYSYTEGKIAKGLNINSYPNQNKIEIKFKDLNFMNKNDFSYKNKTSKIYFDGTYYLSFKSTSEMFPEIDSALQRDIFDRVISKMKESNEMKVETELGSYVIYDISNFTK